MNEFCDSNNLFPVIKHSCSSIDFTYHFNMSRFNILDHFIVFGIYLNQRLKVFLFIMRLTIHMLTILYCWLLLLGPCANYCLCAMNLQVDSLYCLMLKSQNVCLSSLRKIICLIALLSQCLILVSTLLNLFGSGHISVI